jgi:Tfp pilus assembly protein PilN
MSELNLIPYRIKEQRRNKYRVRQYLASGIIVFCVLFFGLYFPMMTLHSLQSEESYLKSQIDAQQTVISENETLKTQTEQLKHYVDQVTKLDLGEGSAMDRVKGLEQFMPKEIRLVWLNYSASEVSMEGTSTGYSQIGEFAANLQMSDQYQSAVITEIQRDDSASGFRFLLTIKQGGEQ